jgi:hypothetical protein
MHYAMLIRLVMIMAIGGFGVAIAILVPVLRLWLARQPAAPQGTRRINVSALP